MIHSREHWRFTPQDQAMLGAVVKRLEAVGIHAERSTGQGFDSYAFTPFGSRNPAWIVVRQYDGVYQLQCSSLKALREGPSLKDVLLPEWLSGTRASRKLS